jgi:hypothetical protein
MKNSYWIVGGASAAFIACLSGALALFGVRDGLRRAPQDFEECAERAQSEQAQRDTPSKDDLTTSLSQCEKQFVGWRKPGGGYTYFDFLQNRQFDIAGPNPTREEQKYFDEQYTLYLEAQRRDMNAASLAEQQNQILQPDLKDDRAVGSISPPGPPLVITPKAVPIPRARSSVIPPTASCDDSSLSCGWTNLSAGLKKFFGSNASGNPP